MTKNKGKQAQKDKDKLFVFSRIREEKELLFGSLDDQAGITAAAKSQKWKEILQEAEEKEAVEKGKDVSWFRDQYFGRMKRETIQKWDACIKTGSGQCPWKEWEIVMCDIIGRGSPILEGLGVPDTMMAPATYSTGEGEGQMEVESSEVLVTYTDAQGSSGNFKKEFRVPAAAKKKKVISTRKEELEARKLEAQVEGLELDNLKKAAEIYEIFTHMGIPIPKRVMDLLGVVQGSGADED